MSISFGLSRLRAYTNGIGTSTTILGTGGAGCTAVMPSGSVWIGGTEAVLSAIDIDTSAVSPASGTKYLFADFAATQSSTATLDTTSVDPRTFRDKGQIAMLGIYTHASGSITNIDTSGMTGLKVFGRAQNCNLTLSYDSAQARGGTLIFANDMKLYNGAAEGTLEAADISGAVLAKILGGTWASGGAASGTMTITATNAPIPFMIETQQITNGVTGTIRLLKCYSNQISMNMDRENYLIPSLSFQAIANQEGVVLTYNI